MMKHFLLTSFFYPWKGQHYSATIKYAKFHLSYWNLYEIRRSQLVFHLNTAGTINLGFKLTKKHHRAPEKDISLYFVVLKKVSELGQLLNLKNVIVPKLSKIKPIIRGFFYSKCGFH